jgi:hypothetical protein
MVVTLADFFRDGVVAMVASGGCEDVTDVPPEDEQGMKELWKLSKAIVNRSLIIRLDADSI